MAPRTGQRRVTVSLDDPSFDAFAEFAALAFPDQPLSAAVREACLAYLGTDPLEAARVSARRTAYLEARKDLSTVISNLLRNAMNTFNEKGDGARNELLGRTA